MNIAPSLLNGFSVKHNLYLFQKFYISGIAYINQEDTTRARQNITRVFMPYKIKEYDELLLRLFFYEEVDIKMYLKCIPDFSFGTEAESKAEDGEKSILCKFLWIHYIG